VKLFIAVAVGMAIGLFVGLGAAHWSESSRLTIAEGDSAELPAVRKQLADANAKIKSDAELIAKFQDFALEARHGAALLIALLEETGNDVSSDAMRHMNVAYKNELEKIGYDVNPAGYIKRRRAIATASSPAD
jgi:hypothetical protein